MKHLKKTKYNHTENTTETTNLGIEKLSICLWNEHKLYDIFTF